MGRPGQQRLAGHWCRPYHPAFELPWDVRERPVAPVAPDHIGFLLGYQSSCDLMGIEITIWGRVTQTDLNRAIWGGLLNVNNSSHARVFDGTEQSSLSPAPTLAHVVSPLRIPLSYHSDTKRFVADNSDPCLLIEIHGESAQERIIETAIKIRAAARFALGQPSHPTLSIRLNCGQAIAFALGLLVAGSGIYQVEYFDKPSQEWMSWMIVGR